MEEILRRKEEQKQRTIEQRPRYNLSCWNPKLNGELKSKAQLGPRDKPVSKVLTTNLLESQLESLISVHHSQLATNIQDTLDELPKTGGAISTLGCPLSDMQYMFE